MSTEQKIGIIPDAESLDLEGFLHPVKVVEGQDGSATYFVTRLDGKVQRHRRGSEVDEDAFLDGIADDKLVEDRWTKGAEGLVISRQNSGDVIPSATILPKGDGDEVVTRMIEETPTQVLPVTTTLTGPSQETIDRLAKIKKEQKAASEAAAEAPTTEPGLFGLRSRIREHNRWRTMRRNRTTVQYGQLRAAKQAATGKALPQVLLRG